MTADVPKPSGEGHHQELDRKWTATVAMVRVVVVTMVRMRGRVGHDIARRARVDGLVERDRDVRAERLLDGSRVFRREAMHRAIEMRAERDPIFVDDPQVVPTEPYSEWVLAGDFPNGRPAWDAVGARFVEDVAVTGQVRLDFATSAIDGTGRSGLRMPLRRAASTTRSSPIALATRIVAALSECVSA